jgi:hypothetical protein
VCVCVCVRVRERVRARWQGGGKALARAVKQRARAPPRQHRPLSITARAASPRLSSTRRVREARHATRTEPRRRPRTQRTLTPHPPAHAHTCAHHAHMLARPGITHTCSPPPPTHTHMRAHTHTHTHTHTCIHTHTQADKYKVPRICFVNKMDRLGANFFRCAARGRSMTARAVCCRAQPCVCVCV